MPWEWQEEDRTPLSRLGAPGKEEFRGQDLQVAQPVLSLPGPQGAMCPPGCTSSRTSQFQLSVPVCKMEEVD